MHRIKLYEGLNLQHSRTTRLTSGEARARAERRSQGVASSSGKSTFLIGSEHQQEMQHPGTNDITTKRPANRRRLGHFDSLLNNILLPVGQSCRPSKHQFRDANDSHDA